MTTRMQAVLTSEGVPMPGGQGHAHGYLYLFKGHFKREGLIVVGVERALLNGRLFLLNALAV